jgi:hypothetical protein
MVLQHATLPRAVYCYARPHYYVIRCLSGLYSLQQTVHQICYKRSETNDNISLLKATLKIRQTKFSLRREKQNAYNTWRPPSSGMRHLLGRYKRFEGTCYLYLQSINAVGCSATFVSHYNTTWRQIPVNKTTRRETPEEQDYLTPRPRRTRLPCARYQKTSTFRVRGVTNSNRK